ncbi:oxidoreductase [Pedobacter lusitanus]|uniref:Oxidoreductase n=1 Tax=Pedobacter lusitanus TaxID=1503925 RepID=A0A0D0FS66_9SPHI|nr:Gfo/Idh/MocA family oxidoreductase [Pedobacter lusitanus]KIO75294.1 oxidoreductase [Pedobacter lusitanus]
MKAKEKIIIIGAGNVVKTGHLPAYRLAGFTVSGIYDIDKTKAIELAAEFGIPKIYSSISGLLKDIKRRTVIDMAIPASAIVGILEQLPEGTSVLMQKPMGENMEQAKEILNLCRSKKLNAGVNFQLRYAPFITEARRMIDEGLLGEIYDIEVNVNVCTPWHMWGFLRSSPRLEILYHSIHYIDLIRSVWGNPSGVYAKTVKHPATMELGSVRSNIIMDYGDRIRANILTNHSHNFGLQNQQSYIKFEGTRGAIKIKMGLLMDYPVGVPDEFEYITFQQDSTAEWKRQELNGSWFPDAFTGSMEEILKSMISPGLSPDNSVEDAIYTMACVEAAYLSSETGAQSIDFGF